MLRWLVRKLLSMMHPQQLKALGKFLFVKNEKGKLVAVKDVTPFQSIQNGECFHVNQIVTIKDKQYLECSSANETIYFLVSENKLRQI